MPDQMFVVKISNCDPRSLIIRQTPGGKGIWNNCIFKCNEDVEECDFWVVYEGMVKKDTTMCPKNGTMFISGEPPQIRRYNPYFLDQFSSVLTCQPAIRHKNKIIGQQCLPWFVGIVYELEQSKCYASMNFDDLKDAKPKKDRLLSVITSNKTTTSGHRKRLEFIRMMERHFGGEFDAFTPDKPRLKDKWEAVSRYKYHLAIENSIIDDYWTEKIADPFLGNCHPFYYGCPNIAKYFEQRSFTPIDISRPEKALKTIEKAIDDEVYERTMKEVADSKARVLYQYNLFTVISAFVESANLGEKRAISLEPEKQLWWGLKERARYRSNQILNRFNI